jgi:hypothetical protein
MYFVRIPRYDSAAMQKYEKYCGLEQLLLITAHILRGSA